MLGWQPRTVDRSYLLGQVGARSMYLDRSEKVSFVESLVKHRRLNRVCHGYKSVTLSW